MCATTHTPHVGGRILRLLDQQEYPRGCHETMQNQHKSGPTGFYATATGFYATATGFYATATGCFFSCKVLYTLQNL